MSESVYERNKHVASEIRRQLGHRAAIMLGAKDFTAIERGLSFKIGRNAKGVNKISITLEPSDTYRVTFSRVYKKRGSWDYENKVVADVENVYVDSLHDVIEHNTEMRTGLGTLGR